LFGLRPHNNLLCLAPFRQIPPHKSKSTSITCGEGQQNGAGVAPPLRFLLRGRCAGLFTAEVHLMYRGNVTAQA